MVMSIVRFNMILPSQDPAENSERHRVAIDMAQYCDEQGFAICSLEEHHGAENGWNPSPLITAGMVFARTQNIGVSISALLVPLHDPLRLAEDIATLDLVSGGRLTIVTGLGYRPIEYHAHRKEWTERGKILDHALDTMIEAWKGEPFEYEGETIVVTPKPLSQPHPMVLVGGSSKPAARRAARLGLPFMPPSNLEDLEAYYYEKCTEYGTAGFCIMPGDETAMLLINEDPERAWEIAGEHFLHEAMTYSSWQTPAQKSSVHSHASTVDELRAEGIYQILTPDECVSRIEEQGAAAAAVIHPLCGGMPIDLGWESLHLYGEQVLPRVT